MAARGMKSFAFHALDAGVEDTVAALRLERPAIASFAVANELGLNNLDPETAARMHARQALDSPLLPTLTASVAATQDSDLLSLGTEKQPLTDTTIVKFRQVSHRIPVYGSLVTVELDNQNELLAIKSTLGEPANIDPVAAVSPAQVMEKVRQFAGYSAAAAAALEGPTHRAVQYVPALDAVPRLFFYFDAAANRWRLTYIVEAVQKLQVVAGEAYAPPRPAEGAMPAAADPEAVSTVRQIEATPEIVDYVFDAHSGALVAELPRMQSAGVTLPEVDGLGQQQQIRVQLDSGVHSLHDDQNNVHTYDHAFAFANVNLNALGLNYVKNPPPPWNPGAISAHANAAAVARFLREKLARNGIDNRGGRLSSSINCLWSGESVGREWRNAAWLDARQHMIYGQRTVAGSLRSYAVSRDVVAHEVFHGVTSRTSRLEYEGETGALNESYSDIFGIIISNVDEPDLGQWNWEMGEDLNGTGVPLRNLERPRDRGQPDHMSQFVVTTNDHGGVHTNSGIHNKAAYNLITSRDAAGNFLFDAMKVSALFYVALTQFLSRTSTFADSREAVELVARTLFRNDSAPLRTARLAAVSNAFQQVGIV